MELKSIIIDVNDDESSEFSSAEWEIKYFGEITDSGHRETIRSAFATAFATLTNGNVDVYFSDDFHF